MVYANDAWVQLPVKDLYDSQMMLASVEAAKDMYDKRAKAMDDFYKNYGDFQSPFSKDMEEYANMINRPADIINKLYENGIDPLRSAEGAAVVQQAIRQFSIPTYNQMKANAALGYEYLKSISSLEEAGKFNLDREVWELKRRGIIPPDAQINDKNQLLGYFSSVGDKGYNQWGKLAGTPNISAHDVFAPLVDDLKPHDLSNDEALKEFGLNEIPGYYWTDAITPSDIRNTLAVNIPGISNTADYQYLLHTVGGDYGRLLDYATNSVREYIRNPKKTADEGYWRNKEWEHDRQMENLRFINNKRLREEKGDSSGKTPKEATSYGQTLLMRGISNWSGSSDPGVHGLEIAEDFGKRVANAYTNPMEFNNAFLNFYSMEDAETSSSWRVRFSEDSSRTDDAAVGGVRYIPTQDNNKLYTLNEMTSATLNYPTGQVQRGKKNISNKASMVPTGKIYTAPMRDGTYSQFVEVAVGDDKGSQIYYYKIAETEPSPVNTDMSYRPQWQTQQGGDRTFAPMGYSIVPSRRTRNSWSMMDAALNKATGLATGEIKAGQGYYLDE